MTEEFKKWCSQWDKRTPINTSVEAKTHLRIVNRDAHLDAEFWAKNVLAEIDEHGLEAFRAMLIRNPTLTGRQ